MTGPLPSCTHENHDAVRRDAATFLACTLPGGMIEAAAGVWFEMRTCARCGSSLSLPAEDTGAPIFEAEGMHLADLKLGWRMVLRQNGGVYLHCRAGTAALHCLHNQPRTLRLLAMRVTAWLLRAYRHYPPDHVVLRAVERARTRTLHMLVEWEAGHGR